MLEDIQSISSLQGPETIQVGLPKNFSRHHVHIEGELYLSPKGYVYSVAPKAIVWLKFLGLGLYLPFQACLFKVKELALRFFSTQAIPAKGYHDLEHSFHLAKIAWKAVLGWNDVPLIERIEEFALAELNYNNPDPSLEIRKSRSERLLGGMYVAKCMQPLFHQSQLEIPPDLNNRLNSLNKIQSQLEDAISKKSRSHHYAAKNHYDNMDSKQILQQLQNCKNAILILEQQQLQAKRCEQYAIRAIFDQQCCFDAQEAFRDTFVEKQAEVECCDYTWYRQERICGILYKIDCCARRCWAIDCLCCFCCLWPDARSFCII